MSKSKYDELKSYLPQVFTSIFDVDIFLKAVGNQADAVNRDTFQMRDNLFIHTSDEETILRWEKFLGIPYDITKTFEDRQKLIVSYFSRGKIGAKEIKDIVKVFTISPVRVSFNNSKITVEIMRDNTDTFILTDCYMILRKKLPAHLDFDIKILSTLETNVFYGVFLTTYKEEMIN